MIQPDFDSYLKSLCETPFSEHTEHTGRTALENLLKAVADSADGNIGIQQEPQRVADKGAPDFKVSRQGMILGYVETKAVGDNLDQVLKSDQLQRYKSLSDNILLTDYLHFIWINRDGVQRESLCHATDLESRRFRVREDRAEAVAGLLIGFFSTPPEGIDRSRQLALALATRSRLLRDYLGQELVRQEKTKEQGRLYGLYQVFRDQVFHELTLKEFADAFAQMLAYGLFLAKINTGTEAVTLQNAREFVPGSFTLIRELVDFLAELDRTAYRNVHWVVEEVLSIVNGLNMPAIHEDLSFRGRAAISRRVRASSEEEHRLFERDPFIYFYEDYLKAYDKATRKARGVYYTPPPVVNFIVRAIDEILKEKFDIHDGFADHRRVTVLDFACGTGTFLLEIFERIFDQHGGAASGHADLIVREHLLENIFGFEYLIAPYTIAHLKLSQYLKDKGHPLSDNERLKVFLTNTLEPIEPQRNLLLPAVTEEVAAAQRVKDQPVLVITGNPPYSGHSRNKGTWIKEQIGQYKFTREKDETGVEAEQPLGERNSKWLNDDYVKFIRFAQWKMDQIGTGIVGIITNHSWLDNPTFRGMRQSLTRTFDQIYVLDLHGSTKPRELTPDHVENENVFDITKGVCISLLVKNRSLPKGIWYAEVWGSRLEKYQFVASCDFQEMEWQEVECVSPFYYFRPIDWSDWTVYAAGWPISDTLNSSKDKTQLFDVDVLGFQSHRDHFAISFERTVMEDRVKDLVDGRMSDGELLRKYRLRNNRDWNIGEARKALRRDGERNDKIMQCSYRPFDSPYCFFGYEFMDYPRRELLNNVAQRENISLVVPRQIGTDIWRHVFVAEGPPNDCLVSDQSREACYVFPMWRYGVEGDREENLSQKFLRAMEDLYDKYYSSEEVLGYIYSVLHSSTYRGRFRKYLRIDFPRIPFPKNAQDFENLSSLGWTLVKAHLLQDVVARGLAGYLGRGSHEIENVRYSGQEEAIYINQSQCFKPVTPSIWEFHIGGYQVLKKYLTSRKGRRLTLDEIGHVGKVADSLAFTIDQMVVIDVAYRAAFRIGDKSD
ncbi:MAG: N-6 DNA methylase [Defluviicoccus sp.]|nr:N-6 DNA methylase [Defluviicoccus sp.]MDE0382418.1 N-6 DNA methylase [Defluviicoccus sp.]